MADTTAISWTRYTWNPWRGCTNISPGCDNCYMFTAQYKRARQTGRADIWDPTKVQRTTTWRDPVRWQKLAGAAGKTELVFTCSWSDFFHADADQWRPAAWEIIRACPNLHFQILTKRPGRIRAHLPPDWRQGYPNVWLGVSVESPQFLFRIDLLRELPARVRFLSVEPLLERIPADELNLAGIQWVIVGGESGPGFRPMDHAWAREIRDLCQARGVAFFFKQSAAPRTELGTKLDGREWKEYPLRLFAVEA